MSKQLKGTLYYLVSSIRFELTVFWLILLAFLLLTVISAILMPDSIVSFTLSAPLYAYAAAIGFMSIKRAFPYLIKMGSTRKNLSISFGIFAFGLAVINAIVATTIDIILSALFGKGFGGVITVTEHGTTMNINHIGDVLSNNTWFTRIIIDTSIAFFLLAVLFIIGLIFYRFGLVGGFSFLGAVSLIFILGFANGWLIDFFKAMFTDFSFIFFIQLFGVGLAIYLISFLLLRRLTV